LISVSVWERKALRAIVPILANDGHRNSARVRSNHGFLVMVSGVEHYEQTSTSLRVTLKIPGDSALISGGF
jgi:hypothetical protein